MRTLFDPKECAEARHLLENGNAIEAARVLLSSQDPRQKCARELRLEAKFHLIAQAAQAYENGEIEVAYDAILLADECAALQADEHALQRQIAWDKRRIDEAKAKADKGHLLTAIDIVSRFSKVVGDIDRVRADIAANVDRFTRYIAECRRSLDSEKFEAAWEWLKRAQRVMPTDPEVVQLARDLLEAAPRLEQCNEASGPGQTVAGSSLRIPRPVEDRWTSFTLNHDTLVVSAPAFTIGTPRGDCVHLSIMGPLHGLHALIVRDRGRYRLVPYWNQKGERCQVSVDGHTVGESMELKDNQVLHFGTDDLPWFFRIPVERSTTAVLVPTKPRAGRFHRVVLLDDILRIGSAEPAHIVMQRMPEGVTRVDLKWQNQGLCAKSDAGYCVIEPQDTEANDLGSRIHVPARLTLHTPIDDAELLVRSQTEDIPYCLSILIDAPPRFALTEPH